MKAGNTTGHNGLNGNKNDAGVQSPRFNAENLSTLSAHCPVDLVASAYVEEHLLVDVTTEASRSTPLSDFQHFEVPEDFSSIMDFDIPGNPPMWNVSVSGCLRSHESIV